MYVLGPEADVGVYFSSSPAPCVLRRFAGQRTPVVCLHSAPSVKVTDASCHAHLYVGAGDPSSDPPAHIVGMFTN